MQLNVNDVRVRREFMLSCNKSSSLGCASPQNRSHVNDRLSRSEQPAVTALPQCGTWKVRGNVCCHASDRKTSAPDASTSGPVEEEFLEDLTRDYRSGSAEEDWERRQLQALRERKSWREGLSFHPDSLPTVREPQSFGEKVQGAIDKILIADFFLVCLSLLLLIVGLGERIAFNTSNIVDLWLPAWPLVVQPCIGILMAGALLSGLVGWFKSDISKSN